MKTLFVFFKNLAKAYSKNASKNYSWLYTGCTYYTIIDEEKNNKEN